VLLFITKEKFGFILHFLNLFLRNPGEKVVFPLYSYVYKCGGLFPPQFILGCRRYAPLLTRSVNTRLALGGAWSGASWCYWSAVGCGGSGRLAVEVGWRRCDGRATCGQSRLTALRWPGDLWPKSADGAAMAGRLVVEVGWRRCDRDYWVCCSALRLARWCMLFSGAR
jgi:hypothetical protein